MSYMYCSKCGISLNDDGSHPKQRANLNRADVAAFWQHADRPETWHAVPQSEVRTGSSTEPVRNTGRAFYFRPVITLIENDKGGYDTYIDFHNSFTEASVEGNPNNYEADDDDPAVQSAVAALDKWIASHPDLETGTNDSLRFVIPPA